MFKKMILLIAVTLSTASLTTQAFWQSDITMLVMPREVLPIQIAQDISRRYPVLLVSYQMVQGRPKIHAWNGDSWVAVPMEDYANGTFFANRPKHAIVVEYDRFRAPASLIPNSTWCESANSISSAEPRVLIHLLGLYFNFPYSTWDQFATRYGYSLEEINPTLSNVHWWNIRGDELVEKRAKRDFSIDLNEWHYLKTLPPPPIEPVVMQEEPKSVPEVEMPASEPVKVIKVNAPATPEEKAPAVKPAPAVNPFPPVEPASATIPASIPALTPAPEIKPVPSLKPEPVIEPAPAVEPEPAVPVPAMAIAPPASTNEPAQTVMPAPAPLIELPSASPTAVEADPFAPEEIPAAEIIVPQPPKKPWWKLF